MKLQVMVAAIALMFGTTAFADLDVTTTTTKVVKHHHHHHHNKHHHAHHHMHHHGHKVVTKTVVHEEMSPPGSLTEIK